MGEDDNRDGVDRRVRVSPPEGLRGARAVRTLCGSFSAGTVAISPDGRLGLCGGAREPVRLWELATGRRLRDLGSRGAGQAGVATDGRWVLASGKGRILRCTLTGGALASETYHPQGLRPPSRVPPHDRSRCLVSENGAVVFSATTRFVLGICKDDALRMWDLTDGASRGR